MAARKKARADKTHTGPKLPRRYLVQDVAAKLRDIILEKPPGAQIGSLGEVGRLLGVGVVTVQQAARVLEHEGLLEVRRGPGGGYYGTRPDEAALERSVAAYMRVHGSSGGEIREMVSLLDCEIIAAAARCKDESLHLEVRALKERVESCNTEEVRIAFEDGFRRLLFKMDPRPFFEVLTRVAMRLYGEPKQPLLFPGDDGVAAWKAAKHRMLGAILQRDEALARFEASRYREDLLARMRRSEPRR